jgi:lipocalin
METIRRRVLGYEMMTDETTFIILKGKGRSTFILSRQIEKDEENEEKITTKLQQHFVIK